MGEGRFYQDCSVGGIRVQNGPAAWGRGGPTEVVQLVAPGSKMALQHGVGGGLGLENEICLKIFSRTARLRCLKFGM